MARAARRLLFGLALWLTGVGLAMAGDPRTAPPGPPDQSQQVLLLLRLPPQHYRPNADYGGGYGDEQGHAARLRVASRLAREHGLALVTDWPMPLLGVDCFVLAVPPGQSPDAVAALLSRAPGVAWSEPSHVYHAQGATAARGDPLFRVQPAARAWRLNDLHQIATGRGVVVAVVDSMIEQTHPDLIGQVQVSENFVLDHPDAPEAHGTGVAGVIAARADNGIGIVGVAPRARLMALRACWQRPAGPPGRVETVCNSLSLAKALHFAIEHNAQVINLSLSGPPAPLLGRLLDAASARGVVVVGAFDRGLPGGGFPASHPGVVAVEDDTLEAPPAGVYSAPGHDVPTTQPGGRWFLVNGSSYATAHVSGLFALARERRPLARGPLRLVAAKAGGGEIDACATLLRAAGPCDCACAHPSQYSAIDR
jgi:hypothetical protein